MFDATREEGDRDRKREIGRESNWEQGRGRGGVEGELLRAREKHLKLLRAMLIQRVRRTLSRIAMFYIIIPAAIRGRSAHRKTSRIEQTQWNCHNTLWIIIGRGYNPRPLNASGCWNARRSRGFATRRKEESYRYFFARYIDFKESSREILLLLLYIYNISYVFYITISLASIFVNVEMSRARESRPSCRKRNDCYINGGYVMTISGISGN